MLIKSIEDQYALCKINYANFIKTGKLTDKFIDNAIFLAKLKDSIRSMHPALESPHNTEDINDIRSMFNEFNLNLFKAKKSCYLHPCVGQGSPVGGAFPDLIIDDTLIDIKTSRALKLTRDQFDQLICYYILSRISGINKNKKSIPIKSIGIYFARFGELWTVPISELGDENKFSSMTDWFIIQMNTTLRYADQNSSDNS